MRCALSDLGPRSHTALPAWHYRMQTQMSTARGRCRRGSQDVRTCASRGSRTVVEDRRLSLQLDLDLLALFELEWNALLLHLEEIVAGRQRHLADGGVDDPGLAAIA